MQKKIPSQLVGSSHYWAGIFFCIQVVQVIMKIVTPCFNRLTRAFYAGMVKRVLFNKCGDRALNFKVYLVNTSLSVKYNKTLN